MAKHFLLLVAFIVSSINYAQETQVGEVITEYGDFYKVENSDFKTDVTAQYSVVFDIGRSFEDPSKPNPLIETAARFINMHREAGVPSENIHVALVIHGGASTDILKDEKYTEKFSEITENPNTKLITELANQGAQIILCGQTAVHRKITKSEALPEVKIALSAMTALVQLQNQGYRLINF